MRLVIEAALRQGVKLIPVFLGEVKDVPGHKLPKSLQELPMLNATRVRSGHDFIPDLDRLIRGIERISKEQDARRGRNKAALAALKQSAIEIKKQLAQVEALMIQETRKRTRLEKQALKFEAQVDDSLIDPGKLLLVDTSDFEQEIERLNEGLHELVLQVEARKQGLVTEEEATQQESHPAQEEAAVEPAAEPRDHGERAENITVLIQSFGNRAEYALVGQPQFSSKLTEEHLGERLTSGEEPRIELDNGELGILRELFAHQASGS